MTISDMIPRNILPFRSEFPGRSHIAQGEAIAIVARASVIERARIRQPVVE
jgi:hypothetical protein